MLHRWSTFLLVGSLAHFGWANAQPDYSRPYSWQTSAGLSPYGFRDGAGAAAQFAFPGGVAVASSGTIYVTDTTNCVIRAISTSGVVSTLAGQPGVNGYQDGSGSGALFEYPAALTVAPNGNIYVADGSQVIRQITPAGVVTTVVGTPWAIGSSDGQGVAARFWNPSAIASDGAGNLYVGDGSNLTVRKITPNYDVTTFAGAAGVSGSQDGSGPAAQFGSIGGLAVDGAGNVYVADTANQTIRKITPAGVVSTFAGLVDSAGTADGTGSGARFHNPAGLAVSISGNIAIVDSGSSTIRIATPAGTVTTLAGNAGVEGFADGTGAGALFSGPSGVAVDPAGNFYVADTANATIRRLTAAGVVTTLAGSAAPSADTDGSSASARFSSPWGVARDPAGNAYITDFIANTVRKVTTTGSVVTLAGSAGTSGSLDAVGAAARFNGPAGIAVDSAGVVFVADSGNNVVRCIALDGTVTTFAGTAGVSGSLNGTGAAAQFNDPQGLAIDGADNLYVADSGNQSIRKITPAGVVSTFAGTAGVSGAQDGSAATAQFNGPAGVAVDAAGAVYVADSGNGTIRKIAGGQVSTVAGTAANDGSTDATGTAASFFGPEGVAVDGAGYVYVADTFNNTIRAISPSSVVTTLGGMPEVNNRIDGIGSIALFNMPIGIASDASGHLLVADSGNNVLRTGALQYLPLSIAQDTSSQSVSPGDSVVFSVAVSGTGPFRYQWSLNGSNLSDQTGISGAKSASLVLGNAQPAEAGTYRVVITDSFGGSVADSATLTVTVAAPTIVSGPAAQTIAAGSTVSFAVVATGDPTYQWMFNGRAIAGATNSSYTITNTPLTAMGAYSVVISNAGGTISSLSARLTVLPAAPVITQQPVAATVMEGSPAAFSVGATNSPSYQWNFNGSLITGATGSSYSITNTPLSAAGNYTVTLTNSGGTVTSQSASLTVLLPAPVITSSPVSAVVNVGSTAGFSVVATNSPTYQWAFNGVPIAGATSSSYSIPDAPLSAAGAYTVALTNSGGTVTSLPASLTVLLPAPVITTSPVSVAVNVGSTAGLSAVATNSPTYQWAFNGVPIAGATSSTYSIPSAPVSAAGAYTVTASNSGGSATSDPAFLTVTAVSGGPAIISQPSSLTAPADGTIVLSVAANAGSTSQGSRVAFALSQLGFQWFCDGVPLADGNFVTGSQAATLILRGNAVRDAVYTCLITSASGSVLSQPARVSVVATTNPGRLTNVSCRAAVDAGPLIAGFVVGGNGSSGAGSFFVRASGPALAALQVSNALPDPLLQLYRLGGASVQVGINDGWGGDSAIAAAAARLGAFPWPGPSSHDAALIESLPSGAYTANISGESGDSGIALAEVYDNSDSANDSPATPHLINVSARASAGAGGNALIAGFVIGGETARTVLIRASGPALARLGLSGALADPRIQLYRLGSNTPLAVNAGWGADPTIAATAAAAGAFAWGTAPTADSAILTSLPPGAYTANVSGATSDSGVALIEIYAIE